jgi:hypothetical protein
VGYGVADCRVAKAEWHREWHKEFMETATKSAKNMGYVESVELRNRLTK